MKNLEVQVLELWFTHQTWGKSWKNVLHQKKTRTGSYTYCVLKKIFVVETKEKRTLPNTNIESRVWTVEGRESLGPPSGSPSLILHWCKALGVGGCGMRVKSCLFRSQTVSTDGPCWKDEPEAMQHQQWLNIPSESTQGLSMLLLVSVGPGILLLGSHWPKGKGAVWRDHQLSRQADLVEMFIIKLNIYRHFFLMINCTWRYI